MRLLGGRHESEACLACALLHLSIPHLVLRLQAFPHGEATAIDNVIQVRSPSVPTSLQVLACHRPAKENHLVQSVKQVGDHD